MAKKATVNLVLRLPKSLHKRLKQQANEQNVSLNSQILRLLTRAVAFVGPSGEIPGSGAGELGEREGGGSELVLNLEGKLYRFVTEATIDLGRPGRPAPPKKMTVNLERLAPPKK